MSKWTPSPGETNIASERFSPSVLLFWLKTEMHVSSQRVMTRYPNTILGLVPLGYNAGSIPVRNIAGVSTQVKFSLWRALLGLVVVIIGLAVSTPLNVILILVGVLMLVNSMWAALLIQNNGGTYHIVAVSVLEKAKIEAFGREIEQRVFADNELMRHHESMSQNQRYHQQSADLQQQSLQYQAAQLQQQEEFLRNLQRSKLQPEIQNGAVQEPSGPTVPPPPPGGYFQPPGSPAWDTTQTYRPPDNQR